MHTSDSIHSISATKNVSHQSHLLRLRQYLMAQSAYPANPLKKSRFSKCVNRIADQAGAQTDKSKRDQDGSAYHQPMRILHCGESAQLVRLTYSPSVANLNQFG
jgi:hypothetical protein